MASAKMKHQGDLHRDTLVLSAQEMQAFTDGREGEARASAVHAAPAVNLRVLAENVVNL